MPTAYATHLVQFGGREMGLHRFAQAIPLETAGAIKAGKVSGVSTWQPWDQTRAATVLALHPLAVWESLSITVESGQGIFGRAVTLHFGWSHHGEAVPKTHADFVQLYGYTTRTVGGAADPGSLGITVAAPFNETRSDVLKASNFPVGEKLVLHYMFTESNFGTTQVEGERFLIIATGEYKTYGQL